MQPHLAQYSDKKVLELHLDYCMDLAFLRDRRDACQPGSAGHKHYEREAENKAAEVECLLNEMKRRGVWN